MSRSTRSAAAITIVLLSALCAASSLSARVDARAPQAAPATAKLLPASGEIAGWKTDGEALTYSGENLWEYIDGAADNFLTYDFKDVVAQDYLSAKDASLKVEIYHHASPLLAFGIYTQNRNPECAFYDIGNEAFGDELSLSFWKGCYYVRVAVFEQGPESLAAMKAFASAVAAKIKDAGNTPGELALFPKEGLVDKATTYVTEGVLGREKFPPAFIGTYRFGGDEGKLYLMQKEEAQYANMVLRWYARESGASVEEIAGSKKPFFKAAGRDPFQGPVLIFQYDKWVGVFTGFGESAAQREAIFDRLIKNLAG